MREIYLVTGGCRSGKSNFALKLAESIPGERCFIATCPALDNEMKHRIEKHQRDRQGRGWNTIEEAVNLAGVLKTQAQTPVIVIDCLTLWISNLMFQPSGETLSEEAISTKTTSWLDIIDNQEGILVVISNEVGLGIVPENALARRFRDLSGRAQQLIAKRAKAVALMVAGIPLWVKGAGP